MRKRGDHITQDSPAVVMAKVLSHPVRVRILMKMNAPLRALSPIEFSEESDVELGLVAYHFRKLEKWRCIKIADEIKRRGATEHRYVPTKRAMAWTREWEDIGPYVKQNLAASALRGAVEIIGEAVDQGTFEGLPDSILAWDVMRVDKRGWEEVHAIWEKALVETLKVGDECRERFETDPSAAAGTSLISYLVSTFESPEPAETGRT